MPMTYFTQEEMTPSITTLNIIRQVAYSFRTVRIDGKVVGVSLN